MRVLQLTQRFPPALGGVETHVWNLASRLPREGVEVEVFTTDLRKDIPLERLEGPVPPGPAPTHRFHAVKAADLPHALGNVAPSMLAAILSDDWDVLHAHAYGYFPTFAGAFGRLLGRAPLVITPHADPGRASARKWAFDRFVPLATLRRADRLIALTHREATYLASLGVSPDRIVVIPNGVDAAEFDGGPARSRASEGVTALFAGRCYPQQKGLEFLLRAVALLPNETKVRLRIVGEDWGGRAVLLPLARHLGIEDRVVFVGPLDRPSLLREYAAADVFVLPSLFDSFPIALLEAMAAGLPVVATRVGGVSEVVEDGQTGILVEPRDAAALAQAIDALATGDAGRRGMGRAGRERSLQFDWDTIIPRIKRVYAEALAERAS